MIALRTFVTPHYTARHTLSGRVYEFRFAHNARLNRWYVTITTEAGEQIAGNRKLVVGQDLLEGATHAERPAGRLFVTPTGKGLDSPRLDDIGDGGEYTLVYLEPGE